MKQSAFTAPGGSYPGYINLAQGEDGAVVVTVRSPPTTTDGIFICGFAKDKGMPGRCTPGDERCNNYCNHDHAKPMAERALPCTHVHCGETASFQLSSEQWQRLLADFEKQR